VWPQVIVFVQCVCFVILCLRTLDHPQETGGQLEM
jgi:hypothetical protein